MGSIAFTLLNILCYVSVLALIALGLSIVFGMMDVVNLAHAEFVTIGAYTVAVVERWTGGAAGLPGSYWLGLCLAPLVGGVCGLLIEMSVIRPLYRRTLDTLLATYALSLILQTVLQMVFGTLPLNVYVPFNDVVSVFGAGYPQYRLFMMAIGGGVIGLCLLVFAKTPFGTDLRAIIQNAEMAEAMGINTRRLNRIAFASGAALAALAGALVAPLTSVQAYLGSYYLAKAFFVVVLGGMGSILGGILGSGLVGTAETLLNYQMDPSFASALVLALAIVIIRFRPQGLIPGFSAAHHLLGKE
jgi:urea ABC transporter permease protein UrtB